MNSLTTYQGGLPETAEDLAHFLLIAPEKAAAMRAEIRAIQKVGLAKAVYDQKLEEQRRLCDMILDASVRLGEMTKALPKATAGNQYTGKMVQDSAVHNQKPKCEVVRDLGFSPKQIQRFETLAENKDLVELEKIQAREEGRMPTRTKVIDMVQARKQRYVRDMERIDTESKIHRQFIDVVFGALKLPSSEEVVSAIVGATEGDFSVDLDRLEEAIGKLKEIQMLLRREAHRNGT